MFQTSFFMENGNFSQAVLALLIAVSLVSTLMPFPAMAQEEHDTVAIMFWAEGCPHCASEKEFLKSMAEKYPAFRADLYEVAYNESNRELFSEFAKCYEGSVQGVPVLILGNDYLTGYSDAYSAEFEEKIRLCIENGCLDPYERLEEYRENQSCIDSNQTVNQDIDIPFIGKIDAAEMSLPLLAVVIGFLDGFNPCAFFVLFFLLSMLVYAKSRKRMLLIGGIFVFFSGFVYLLFMAAWLSFFQVAGALPIVTTFAGLVALIIGAVNVKDFFFFKKGVSFSISDENRSRLARRMRELLKADSLPTLVFATAVLAIAANSYELLCTAGFPMVFTRILTMNNLSSLEYLSYLVLYNAVYVLPLLTIVIIFSYTMGARKLTQGEGEILKLLSGLMMFFLGAVLILSPALLTNLLATAIILLFAVLSASVIVLAKKAFFQENISPGQGLGEERRKDLDGKRGDNL
ncbi:MAG: hypothetical protein JW727_00910 [Candidatus Aenigmarchaeota archaeon]|nr:hypothetical protein [Candidatus Aenigmarchaeota archaeon]